ncbi:MAG TPA: hypothetical protein VLX44_08840 [Xanthobacteraceae bacterium]|nr:hypothetical protein [Xanthobacteraceae bacterium]
MRLAASTSNGYAVPKRERHHSYDESLDAPPKLIADEIADVEAEVPADENDPIERIEEDDTSAPSAFEEE